MRMLFVPHNSAETGTNDPRNNAVNSNIERSKFLEYLQLQNLFSLREPMRLFEGLAAYQFHDYWEADPEFCLRPDFVRGVQLLAQPVE